MKDENFKKVKLAIINIAIILIVLFLQSILYETTESLLYGNFKDNFDKEDACIDIVNQNNKTLGLEILIGGIILTIINYFFLKNKAQKPIRTSILLLLLYLLVTGISLTYFSTHYININMEPLQHS